MDPIGAQRPSFSVRFALPRLRDCGMLKLPAIEIAAVFLLATATAIDMTGTGLRGVPWAPHCWLSRIARTDRAIGRA